MSLNYSSSFYQTISAVEGDHFWFRARSALIAQLVTRFSPKRQEFCEIGCGTGIILKVLSRLGYPVTGMDINKEAIRYASRQVPKATLIHKSLLTYSPPEGKRYPMVGAFDVLEHIGEDVVFLRHCHRLLAKGGLLFLTVPAGSWLWDGLDTAAGHKRRYEKNELLSKVQDAGFEIVWWNYWQVFTLPLYWVWRIMKTSEKPSFVRHNKRTSAGKHAIADYLKVPQEPFNILLYLLLRFEQFFLMRIRMPIGASIIIAAQKV
jgi:SAM-dependent methyltransferase